MLVTTQLSAIGLPGPVHTDPYDYSTDYYTSKGFGPTIWGQQGQQTNKIAATTTNYFLTGSGVSYTYLGQVVGLVYAPRQHNLLLFAAPANYIYEGGFSFAASVAVSGSGPYSYLGGAAGGGSDVHNRYTLSPVNAVYSYTGEIATLSYRPTVHYILTLDPATYAYIGEDATVTSRPLARYVLTASPGGYSYAGEVITLGKEHIGSRGYLLTTSTRTILGPKRPDQIISPPFDFGLWTAQGDVLSDLVVTVSVWSGVDPSPQTVYAGSTITGSTVYVALQGGIPGVIYQVLVRVIASLSGVLENAAFLAVLPQGL